MSDEMSDRSILRVRPHEHIDPSRKGEWVVEVWRNAEVVASIYGSREGIQVHSERFKDGANQAFGAAVNGAPALVVPLLAKDEACPWCLGGPHPFGPVCPVCRKLNKAVG